MIFDQLTARAVLISLQNKLYYVYARIVCLKICVCFLNAPPSVIMLYIQKPCSAKNIMLHIKSSSCFKASVSRLAKRYPVFHSLPADYNIVYNSA